MPRWNRNNQASYTLLQGVDSFLLDREQANCSPATLVWYRKYLNAFTNYCEAQSFTLQTLTGDDIRRWLVGLQTHLAPRTVNHHASAVRALFFYLVKQGYIPEPTNPMRTVRMPKIPRSRPPAFTIDEFNRLLAAAPSIRDRAILLFLTDTGVRASEFCSLAVTDVNLKTGIVQVRQGKGARDRTVFLGIQARRALTDYLAQRPPLTECRLWLTYENQPLKYAGLSELLERLGAKASVSGCAAHKFRRTFAMWSLRAGMDLVRLAAIMGHTSLTVLQGYLAYVDDDLQAAHRQYGAVDTMLSKKEK